MSEPEESRPKVVFDGACPLCSRWAHSFAPRCPEADFVPAAPGENPGAIRYVGPDGAELLGADALFALWSRSRWPWSWIGWLGWVPGVLPLARPLYRFVARRRKRIGGSRG